MFNFGLVADPITMLLISSKVVVNANLGKILSYFTSTCDHQMCLTFSSFRLFFLSFYSKFNDQQILVMDKDSPRRVFDLDDAL